MIPAFSVYKIILVRIKKVRFRFRKLEIILALCGRNSGNKVLTISLGGLEGQIPGEAWSW